MLNRIYGIGLPDMFGHVKSENPTDDYRPRFIIRADTGICRFDKKICDIIFALT